MAAAPTLGVILLTIGGIYGGPLFPSKRPPGWAPAPSS